MYQQQKAFHANPLKQQQPLRERHIEDDGYYGDDEESQLIQRSVNSRLTSSNTREEDEAEAAVGITTQPVAIEKSTENITIKVGQQAVLPCFINNLGSSKVRNVFFVYKKL